MFWLHGEEFVFGSSVHPVQPHIPQMKMMKVHIPFTFKLHESTNSSYEGNVECYFSNFSRTFSSCVPYISALPI